MGISTEFDMFIYIYMYTNLDRMYTYTGFNSNYFLIFFSKVE